MSDSIMVDRLYDTLANNLKDKEKTKTFEKAIEKYLDKNMPELSQPGPTKLILFTESDKQVAFDATGLDPVDISNAVKESKVRMWTSLTHPIIIDLTLAIRYYKKTNNKNMETKVLSYLVMAMYPSLFKNFWKYDPNPDIMRYTINNLSNKFKLKQIGYFFGTLMETATLSNKTYSSKLIRGTDNDIKEYTQGLNTRIRSLLRKIANEFYENERQKNYMGDEYDDNNPDNYKEADSTSFAVERITNGVVMKLMNGVDFKNIDKAAQMCQVSKSELRNYINTMVTSENRKDIEKIVESILYLFLYDDNNKVGDISNMNFLIYCLEVYKKSNTTDENIIAIKNILDKWLQKLGTYKKTQRLATINNFRKAIYVFFVFSIMQK